MDLKQLRAFITIAETHNITKAAPMLNVGCIATNTDARGRVRSNLI